MTHPTKHFLCAALVIALTGSVAFGQATPITILKLDVDNYVSYINDVSDVTKLASDPNRTTALPFRTFGSIVQIGDIVAVNDKPVKGTLTQRSTGLGLTPNAKPGGLFPNSAIADTIRQNLVNICFEILQADGTPIGSIMAQGVSQGSAPPGAPLAQTGENVAIVGGTGAFLGVRGQVGLIEASPSRTASASEDPANRRLNGGAKRSFIISLIPVSVPEIIGTVSGPAVVHAKDFTLVTAANPAKAGETLTMFAYGMGPTRPGVDPGAPFPAGQQIIVNSPVEVRVGGMAAAVLYAGGYPGAVNTYQVNFSLPSDIQPGPTSLRLSVAWVSGPEVMIPIR